MTTIAAMLGGNGGTQSLAVVIRSLSSDDVPGSRILGVLGRQLRIGLLVGLAVSAATALLTLALLGTGIMEAGTAEHLRVAAVVGLAVFANLSIATTLGAAIPLILRRFGLDPALASSIFLTFATDVVGFGGFLLVATLLL